MIVVDTGVLFAAADVRDHDHQACSELVETTPAAELIVPVTVVTETAYLIATRLGHQSEADFIASIAAGDVTVHDLGAEEWVRVAELLATYTDLGLGLVDATVITVAEHRKIGTIATLNHRDFTVVRPAHLTAFELIP